MSRASKRATAVRPRVMLIDPLVIGEFETVCSGPVAFSPRTCCIRHRLPDHKVKEFLMP